MKTLDKMNPKIWEIQAELSGPTKVDKEILPMEPMEEQGTLVRKYQKCGKKGCRCQRGLLHGPYYWRVHYNKETRKQSWKYIGKMVKNEM